MNNTFHMQIKDLFTFADGRTVLVGSLDGGENVLIRPGPCDVYVNDRKVETIHIEPEMIPQRANPLEFHDLRAVSTLDKTGLTREMIAKEPCRLEGPMAPYGHRHLLGLDSPPENYVTDNMTLGPRLPAGWDGDAWMNPNGDGYFLRAWNKQTGAYAIGTGSRCEEARRKLLDEIKTGNKRVVVTAPEAGT